METSNRSQYRKKPVVIQAVQLRWTTWSDVGALLGAAFREVNPNGAREISAEEVSDTCGEPGPTYIELDVRTVHGEIATVRHGDWIIPDGKPGTFYPCKPQIFETTYEPVDAPTGITMASDRPAEALAALLGPDLAGQAIKAGWDALRPLIAKRPDMVPPGVADYVAATVLLGAAPVVAAEIDRLRKENDLLAPANEAYWAAQKVLDEALGAEAEHGSGEGLAADVRLLMVQRDKAVEAFREGGGTAPSTPDGGEPG